MLLLAVVSSLLQMNREVRDRIDVLATANSDSTQWSLAQSDVEILALLAAIAEARLAPDAPLSQVRTRFDVFYSRARTLAISPLLETVRQDANHGATCCDDLHQYSPSNKGDEWLRH